MRCRPQDTGTGLTDPIEGFFQLVSEQSRCGRSIGDPPLLDAIGLTLGPATDSQLHALLEAVR